MNTSMPTRIDFHGPLCQEAMDEPVFRHEHVVRDLAALCLDRNLRFLARGRMLLERAIGRYLRRLNDMRFGGLGYLKLGDYIAQQGSFSLRKGQELIQLDEQLPRYPTLEAALVDGRVLKSHVMVLLPVLKTMRSDEIEAWVRRAEGLSVRRLRDAVAEYKAEKARREAEEAKRGSDVEAEAGAGGEEGAPGGDDASPCDGGEGATSSARSQRDNGVERDEEDDEASAGEWMQCEVPVHVAQLFEICKEAVARLIGFDPSDSMVLEFCGAEFLNGVGFRIRNLLDDSPERQKRLEALEKARREEIRRTRERQAALQRFLEDETRGWAFLDRQVPEVEITEAIQPPADSESAESLDARLQLACRLLQRVRACMGRMLYTLNSRSLYKDMQFTSPGHYAEERLGMSASSAMGDIRRQRRFFDYHEVRDAYEAGTISQTVADLVMSIAGDFHEKAWLAHALKVSTLQLRCDVAAAKIYLAAHPYEQGGKGNGGVPTLRPIEELLDEARAGESAGPHLDEVGRRAGLAVPGAGSGVQMSAPGSDGGEGVQMSAPGGEAGEGVQISARSSDGGESLQMSAGGSDAGEGVQMSPQGEGGEVVQMSAQGAGAAAPSKSARQPNVRRVVPSAAFPVRLRMRLTGDVAVMMREICDICDRILQRRATTAECLEAMCQSFLDTWGPELYHLEKTHPIHLAQAFRCAVPTCSCRGLEDHHMQRRSRRGSNAKTNLSGLCEAHHRGPQGVHEGCMRVTGTAPRAVVVEQGLKPDGSSHLTFVGGQRVA